MHRNSSRLWDVVCYKQLRSRWNDGKHWLVCWNWFLYRSSRRVSLSAALTNLMVAKCETLFLPGTAEEVRTENNKYKIKIIFIIFDSSVWTTWFFFFFYIFHDCKEAVGLAKLFVRCSSCSMCCPHTSMQLLECFKIRDAIIIYKNIYLYIK